MRRHTTRYGDASNKWIINFFDKVIKWYLNCSQESEGQKTNNGIQYSLHLLYSNGEFDGLFIDSVCVCVCVVRARAQRCSR